MIFKTTYRMIAALTAVLPCTVGAVFADTAFTIAANGRARCAIVLGVRATDAEKKAARELLDYAFRISGVRVPIGSACSSSQDAILIGRVSTNDAVSELYKDGLLPCLDSDLEADGYAIAPVRRGSMRYLVLSGKKDRSMLYAVYDLLERYAGVGYFEDGDYVPKASGISVPWKTIIERPRFEIRQFFQGCAPGYTTKWWSYDQWRREIDWGVKKRYNTIWLAMGREVVWKAIYDRLGVKTPALTPRQTWDAEITKLTSQYARSLGLDVITYAGGVGEVSSEFEKKYPDVKYVHTDWRGPVKVENYHIHPSDPMFRRLQTEFLKEYISRYGTSHIYNCDPYPELIFGADDPNGRSLKLAYARVMMDCIRKVDPKGIWFASGWAFCMEDWPAPLLKEFLDEIPNDSFYVSDCVSDYGALYKQRDYFYGKDWLFGVLHTFGKPKLISGDAKRLISDLRKVSVSPEAAKCRGIYNNPESICHNIIYFTLFSELGWDPGDVSLSSFMDGYVRTRYGTESYPRMRKALDLVVDAFQGADTIWNEPLYWGPAFGVSLSDWATGAADKWANGRESRISKLRTALRLALQESRHQELNELYTNDIVDWYRQLMSEVFNHEFAAAYSAFTSGDKAAFSTARDRTLLALGSIEDVLAQCPRYTLADTISQAKAIPGAETSPTFTDAPPNLELTGIIKADHVYLCNYARTDMWELCKLYYRPRVEAYFGILESRLGETKRDVPIDDLTARFDAILKSYMSAPRPVVEMIRSTTDLEGV